MFNTENISEETKQAVSGIIWFIVMVPLSMLMHFLAKYFERIEYTIFGWLLATIGAVQLGIALARGGKRLFSFPLKVKTPLSN